MKLEHGKLKWIIEVIVVREWLSLGLVRVPSVVPEGSILGPLNKFWCISTAFLLV